MIEAKLLRHNTNQDRECKKASAKLALLRLNLVGVRGFEPPAPASRRQCSTRLSYTPTKPRIVSQAGVGGKRSDAVIFFRLALS